MTDIQLNFINQSSDSNNSSIVIFQKNVATSFNELAIAWKVIQNSTPGGAATILTFPTALQIVVTDRAGDRVGPTDAQPGQMFVARHTAAGLELAYDRQAPNADDLVLLNVLFAPITIQIFRDGALLATRTDLEPGQSATFSFDHRIWIGPAQQLVAGQALNAADVASVNTELNLMGVTSADIVMSGGASPAPFTFTLTPSTSPSASTSSTT